MASHESETFLQRWGRRVKWGGIGIIAAAAAGAIPMTILAQMTLWGLVGTGAGLTAQYAEKFLGKKAGGHGGGGHQ